MSLYVYCLGDDLDADGFEGLAGIGGSPVHLLSLGRIAAVVSDVEGERVNVTGENVKAHNRVNSHALATLTPLPFRFGTKVTHSQLAEYVAANEEALLAALARVRGCVEMSIKIRDASAEAEGETRNAKEVVEGATSVGRGTAFLLSKRREVLGDEALRLRAEESAAWLDAGVSDLARESVARLRTSDSLVVSAAHLVERERVAEYRERVRLLSEERPGLQFLTSGPWPPYSFSDIEKR
jgi:hypothetical protein